MPNKNTKANSSRKVRYDEISQLVEHFGKDSFAPALMNCLHVIVQADHISIFLFDENLQPHLVVAESQSSTGMAKKIGQIYQDAYFYRQDPNTKLLQQGHEKNSEPMITRLKASQISDYEYQQKIYIQFKLLDRISIITCADSRWMIINYYRNKQRGEFGQQDITCIKDTAKLIAKIVEKQFTLLKPVAWKQAGQLNKQILENTLTDLQHSLSRREIQVCARALTGMTNIGIGLDLGIKTSTVATLRKRAYLKLNISSVNELFAICLHNSK